MISEDRFEGVPMCILRVSNKVYGVFIDDELVHGARPAATSKTSDGTMIDETVCVIVVQPEQRVTSFMASSVRVQRCCFLRLVLARLVERLDSLLLRVALGLLAVVRVESLE